MLSSGTYFIWLHYTCYLSCQKKKILVLIILMKQQFVYLKLKDYTKVPNVTLSLMNL